MLRLDRLSISNGGLTPRAHPSIRPNIRPGSPLGGSILITSAPQSARMPAAAGPATQTPSSTTLMPSTGPAMAKFLPSNHADRTHPRGWCGSARPELAAGRGGTVVFEVRAVGVDVIGHGHRLVPADDLDQVVLARENAVPVVLGHAADVLHEKVSPALGGQSGGKGGH